MRGSFSVEAAIIVPFLIGILVLALNSGFRLSGEMKERAEPDTKRLEQMEYPDCVELFYRQSRKTDMGDR